MSEVIPETGKPVRVQLSRRGGWRKPENTVVVARPSKWGNPFTLHYRIHAQHMDQATAHENVVFHFRSCLATLDEPIDEDAADRMAIIKRDVMELAGKNLACWCKLGFACHADVLLEIANAPKVEGSLIRPLKCRHCGAYPNQYEDGVGQVYFGCAVCIYNDGLSAPDAADAVLEWNSEQVDLYKLPAKLPKAGK